MRSRISALQTSNPQPLTLLAEHPDDELELVLHERFKDYRQHGEWFDPAPPILSFIGEVIKGIEEQTAIARKEREERAESARLAEEVERDRQREIKEAQEKNVFESRFALFKESIRESYAVFDSSEISRGMRFTDEALQKIWEFKYAQPGEFVKITSRQQEA